MARCCCLSRMLPPILIVSPVHGAGADSQPPTSAFNLLPLSGRGGDRLCWRVDKTSEWLDGEGWLCGFPAPSRVADKLFMDSLVSDCWCPVLSWVQLYSDIFRQSLCAFCFAVFPVFHLYTYLSTQYSIMLHGKSENAQRIYASPRVIYKKCTNMYLLRR